MISCEILSGPKGSTTSAGRLPLLRTSVRASVSVLLLLGNGDRMLNQCCSVREHRAGRNCVRSSEHTAGSA